MTGQTKVATRKALISYMSSVPHVAFIKDEQGRCIYYNNAAYTWSKFDASDVIGATDLTLYSGDAVRENLKYDDIVRSTSELIEVEETASSNTGSSHHGLRFKFPVEPEVGNGWVGGIAIPLADGKAVDEVRRKLQEITGKSSVKK